VVTAIVSQSMGNWLLGGSEATTTDTQTQQQAAGISGGPGGFVSPMGGNNLYKNGGRFSATSSQEQSANLEVVYQGNLLLYGILILLGISLLGMVIPVVWITRLRPARVLSME
jgi:hypothetical protein